MIVTATDNETFVHCVVQKLRTKFLGTIVGVRTLLQNLKSIVSKKKEVKKKENIVKPSKY